MFCACPDKTVKWRHIKRKKLDRFEGVKKIRRKMEEEYFCPSHTAPVNNTVKDILREKRDRLKSDALLLLLIQLNREIKRKKETNSSGTKRTGTAAVQKRINYSFHKLKQWNKLHTD